MTFAVPIGSRLTDGEIVAMNDADWRRVGDEAYGTLV
jgi:hypothetical protein